MSARVIHGLDALPPELRGSVVAVGDFDGVHLDHQATIALLLPEAERRARTPLVVATRDAASPVRITPPAEEDRLLVALGVTRILLVEEPVAAEQLTRAVSPSFVIAVPDAAGDMTARVRAMLAEGDIAAAAALLGYRWFARGEVIHGDKRGRELGFPTANIALAPSTPLRHGVYAVRVRRAGEILDGVASFGVRPTFGGGAPVLEVFLFDFAGDLYGDTLEVAFVAWIRPELSFDGIAPLVARIREDESEARRILATAGPGSDLDQRLAATNP